MVLGPLTLLLLIGEVPLPGTSSVSVPMQPPTDCLACHGAFEGSAYDRWAGSTMGHAARDPLFLAALDEAEKDVPGVGDFCLRCHAPEAWVSGRCFPTNGGRLLASDSGITCSTCHRMDRSGWTRNGQYKIGEDLDYRGPYTDANPPHRWQFSDYISDSALCGTCHDLRNPLVLRRNLDGTLTDQPFPEQVTYTEWASSDFANGPDPRSCQDCHMNSAEGQVARGGPIRPDRSDHGLVGANVFLKAAIEFLYPELGLGVELQAGQRAAEDMLRTAATLELRTPLETLDRGAAVPLSFRITNLTGHKLPTGYPEGRRMWLEVQSAGLGISRGTFDMSDEAPNDPVGLWHAVQGQYGIGPGYRLALNDTIFFDNRIPPRGFVPTATTAPVGQAFEEVRPGVLAHWDEVTVMGTVACDAPDSPITLEAVLWYQSVTKTYVDALVADGAGSIRAQTLDIAFDEVDPGPLEIARVRLMVPVNAASSCDAPDAGALDTGSTDRGGAADAASAPDAGQPADAGDEPPDEGGCRTGPGPTGALGGALLLGGLWLAGRRRRTNR